LIWIRPGMIRIRGFGMDIRRLKYFISVVDKGSIGRAAGSASLAQPAMSQHMATLEAEVGVKLLVRSPQGVTPTPAGLHFYRAAHAIVRRYDDAIREAAAIGGRNAGTLTIGIPTSMLGILGGPLLHLLMGRFADLRVRVLEGFSGYLTEMALNGRIDIVFAFVEPGVGGLDVRPLLVEEMFLLQPGTGDGSETVTLAEVADTPLVLPGPEHGLRKAVERGLAGIGREPRIVAEIDSYPLLLDSVRQGIAATVISWAGATGRASPQDVRRRRIVAPILTRPVSMCLSESARSIERIEEVAEVIDGLFRSLVADDTWQGVHFVGVR